MCVYVRVRIMVSVSVWVFTANLRIGTDCIGIGVQFDLGLLATSRFICRRRYTLRSVKSRVSGLVQIHDCPQLFRWYVWYHGLVASLSPVRVPFI